MKFSSEFKGLAAALLTVLAVLLLSGCSAVTAEQVAAGDSACEPHGGAALHWETSDNAFRVTCAKRVTISGKVQ